MNWLDITMLCLAGFGLIKGLFDGIIKQVVSIIALVAAIFLCKFVAQWVQGFLDKMEVIPPQAIVLMSYIIGFILIIAVVVLAGELVSRIVGATPLSIVNHIFGGVFGILFMTLFLSLLLNAIYVLDVRSSIISEKTKQESRLYEPVLNFLPTILIPNMFNIDRDKADDRLNT